MSSSAISRMRVRPVSGTEICLQSSPNRYRAWSQRIGHRASARGDGMCSLISNGSPRSRRAAEARRLLIDRLGARAVGDVDHDAFDEYVGLADAREDRQRRAVVPPPVQLLAADETPRRERGRQL